ncbi:hypothetical protein VTK73DRAFT_7497 [Phialemonium thermophilum]|uniref:Amidase domain-containing protein n=1 Tax=Phialemonium thermophilum TaxID=223376 RepID=A0ABR3WE17_9PEZI
MKFDVLTTNAVDLQRLLAAGEITSVEIVETYLGQIERHESELRAFISVASRDALIESAAELDRERRSGRIRGPLHGIPIVLKDNFITASKLGMGTTAGSWALVGAKAPRNSAIAQLLIDNGLIILGKTNMTEFAGLKTTMMSPGWSAVRGQTISPYVGQIEQGETLLGHSSPGGSSTGSAVAVAAGFSPLAMGTETVGSIITPASRAALYAIKPTVGLQNVDGLYTLSDFFDSPGPMSKCSQDTVILTEILLGRRFRWEKSGGWGDLKVGFLDPDIWKMSDEICRQHEGTAEQMKRQYEDVISRMREQGCFVKYPTVLTDVSELTVEGEEAVMPIAFWDFKNVSIPTFLDNFDECAVRSLEEIVKFNEERRDQCLPSPYTTQGDLVKALQNTDKAETISRMKAGLRSVARQFLDDVFGSEGLNIIAAPADSSLCIHAAAAGYPIATVPLGQLAYNGRPFGLCMVAKANDEETLLKFMSTYEEQLAIRRPVPDL